jgi:hypothetical protein
MAVSVVVRVGEPVKGPRMTTIVALRRSARQPYVRYRVIARYVLRESVAGTGRD